MGTNMSRDWILSGLISWNTNFELCKQVNVIELIQLDVRVSINSRPEWSPPEWK